MSLFGNQLVGLVTPTVLREDVYISKPLPIWFDYL